jgi:hypothetical protein
VSDQTASPAAVAHELATADQPCAATDDPHWWDRQPGETPGVWATRITAAIDDSTDRLAAATAAGADGGLAAAQAGYLWALLNAYAAADRASQRAGRRGPGGCQARRIRR